jgi:DNA-binding ferritin-like protein (Dps family)
MNKLYNKKQWRKLSKRRYDKACGDYVKKYKPIDAEFFNMDGSSWWPWKKSVV